MKRGTVGFLSLLTGGFFGALGAAARVGKVKNEELKTEKQFSGKHLALYVMMDRWVEVKQKGKSLADFFKNEDYQKIAIYGMSYAGNRLVKELAGTGIEIKYGIDRDADNICSDIRIYKPQDIAEDVDVDVVVVTPIFFFNEIAEELEKKYSCQIISLADIINAVLSEV